VDVLNRIDDAANSLVHGQRKHWRDRFGGTIQFPAGDSRDC
jgi:hypothetical protein